MSMQPSVDVALVHLPKFEANVVPAAPAILKGIANTVGLTSKVLDFNLDWTNTCIERGFDRRSCLTGIGPDSIPDHIVKCAVDESISRWADQIIELNPRLLAISVFSYYGHYFCHHLARQVRSRSQIKIVMGGPGVSGGLHEEPKFGIFMKENNYIDDYLSGDAERVWLRYLNQFFDLQLDTIPDDIFLDPKYVVDFSDFETSKYLDNLQRVNDNYITDKLIITACGSKGCVRACDFCEIHRYWKYQQRSADHVARDIRAILQQFPECHVEFTDSLVNGNVKEFDRFLDQMIEIRKENPNFTWAGQFIVRSPKACPESVFVKLAASGVACLHIGVETGSERLRFAMDKKFTNADLDFVMEMMHKHGVTCTFMQFVGHPEETDQDFEETLEIYRRYQKYSGTAIRLVQLNWLMAVHKNTPLYDKAPELGLNLSSDPTLWYASSNPKLTMEERVRRRLLLAEHLDTLGFKKATDDLAQLKEMAIGYSKYKYAIKLINRTDSSTG